jgi:cytochrome c peroxidase
LDARARLGRALFFDTATSADGRVSCGTCHRPEAWGADHVAIPTGVFGKVHVRNAPTVLNASGQFVQHWHGDRESLEDQATRSLLGPVSAGNAFFAEAMKRLDARGYGPRFRSAFGESPDALNEKNFATAISAFERSLVTPSRFDAYLEGSDDALTPRELSGLAAFVDVGCARCHDGPNLGGARYARFGVHRPYWTATRSQRIDDGRFENTKVESDRYVFKIPILRNVAETGPYFHDGAIAELREAIRIMGRVQLGIELDDARVADIEAFLRALTGPRPDVFSSDAPPSVAAP